jgi:hypothetical protein
MIESIIFEQIKACLDEVAVHQEEVVAATHKSKLRTTKHTKPSTEDSLCSKLNHCLGHLGLDWIGVKAVVVASACT